MDNLNLGMWVTFGRCAHPICEMGSWTPEGLCACPNLRSDPNLRPGLANVLQLECGYDFPSALHKVVGSEMSDINLSRQGRLEFHGSEARLTNDILLAVTAPIISR